MTSVLPPARDLPPGRHTQIRSALEQAAAGRRKRTDTVPIFAGAAVVAAVAASVALLPPALVQTPAGQPASRTASPTSQPASTRLAPAVTPGFPIPPEEVREIQDGCARSANTGPAVLHQYFDEQTRWALLYSDEAVLTCTIDGPGMKYNAGYAQVPVKWLPGHFTVDSASASAGGDHGKPGHEGTPGHRTVVGRVDHQVARVTVTADDRTVDATIANGTYATRLHHPSDWEIPADDKEVVVRAYDATGALLGTKST